MLTLLVIALIGIVHKQVSNHLSKADMAMNLMVSILVGSVMLMVSTLGGLHGLGGLIISAGIYSATYWTSDHIVAWVRSHIK